MTRTIVLTCLVLGGLAACGQTDPGDPISDVGPDVAPIVDEGPTPGDGDAGPIGRLDGGPDGGLDGGAPDGPCRTGTLLGDPELTIGTGLDDFRPVSPGDELVWVAGMQGSFHLEGAVRIDPEVVAQLSPDERGQIEHEYLVTDLLTFGEASRERIDDGATPFPVFEEGPDGSLQTVNVFLVIEAAWQGLSPDPSFAEGRDLCYQVFVTLPDGTRYERSAEITSSCCR